MYENGVNGTNGIESGMSESQTDDDDAAAADDHGAVFMLHRLMYAHCTMHIAWQQRRPNINQSSCLFHDL